MAEPHNILSLDVGGRRIGVALASLEARLPAPLLTLERTPESAPEESYAAIKQLALQHSATQIVVGLPRGMNGQETAQTAEIRSFAEGLSDFSGLPVQLQDEAGTSLLAEEELRGRGKPYQKGEIDQLAACYILRDWLATQPVETSA